MIAKWLDLDFKGVRMSKSVYVFLYHAIENTANQNTENPLYIRRYYIHLSHRALRECSIDCVGRAVFSIPWFLK